MNNINERAEKYAEGKANEAITKAIAQAYLDGYRDGYKDHEEEIPVDLRDNKTEYIDLGLPSGTLWADRYESEGGKTLFLTYEEASKYNLPSDEQWNELLSLCRWNYKRLGSVGYRYDCIGPNGNCLSFFSKGIIKVKLEFTKTVLVWLFDSNESVDKNAAFVNLDNKSFAFEKASRKVFMGYKLPIRLVCTK